MRNGFGLKPLLPSLHPSPWGISEVGPWGRRSGVHDDVRRSAGSVDAHICDHHGGVSRRRSHPRVDTVHQSDPALELLVQAVVLAQDGQREVELVALTRDARTLHKHGVDQPSEDECQDCKPCYYRGVHGGPFLCRW